MVSYGFLANKYIEVTVVDQRGFIGGEGGGEKARGRKLPPSSFFTPCGFKLVPCNQN